MIKVRYTLQLSYPLVPSTRTSGMPVESIQASKEFDLVLLAQDLRPEGVYYNPTFDEERDFIRGLYAAYINLTFNKSLVAVKVVTTLPKAAIFSPLYSNGKQVVDTTTGLGPLGAFRSGSTKVGTGSEPVEILRLRMTAKKVGVVTFIPNTTPLKQPHYNTLLMGNLYDTPPDQGVVLSSEIECRSTQLVINP